MKIYVPEVIHDVPPREYFQIFFGEKRWEKVYQIWMKKVFRNMLSESQNHKCAVCGVKTNLVAESKRQATIEHIIPTSRGGVYSFENCVMACRKCNNSRSNEPIPEEEIVREWMISCEEVGV